MVSPLFGGVAAGARIGLRRAAEILAKNLGRPISRRELSRQTGIPLTTLRNIELELVTPKPGTLQRVADSLSSDRFAGTFTRERTISVERAVFDTDLLGEAAPDGAGDSFMLVSEEFASPGKTYGTFGPFDARQESPSGVVSKLGMSPGSVRQVVWRKAV